jgi:hypothetical protein
MRDLKREEDLDLKDIIEKKGSIESPKVHSKQLRPSIF